MRKQRNQGCSKLILNWVCAFAAIVIACSGASDNDTVFSRILFVLGVEGLARQWRGKYKLRLSQIYRRSRYIAVFRSIPCPIVRKLIDISIYLVSYTYVSCLKLSSICFALLYPYLDEPSRISAEI